MEWDQILIVIFSGVVAASTVAYAFWTHRLTAETRQMRQVQTEPRIAVRVEASETGRNGYDLVIRNEGSGAAKNVAFEFTGDTSYFRHSWVGRAPPRVNELPIIKNGLDYLEVSQQYRFDLGTVTKPEFERASESPWIFRTVYDGLYGSSHSDTYRIDFSQFGGTFFVPDRLKEIANHISKIQLELKNLNQNISSLGKKNQCVDSTDDKKD